MIVMERGLENPSAMVAGLQYQELFARHGGYEVSYHNLISAPAPWQARLIHYGRMLRLSPLIDLLEERRQSRHEDRLIERAAGCDVIFAIKIPSLGFYTRLKKLGRPKILTCFADGLWLPYFRRGGWHTLEEVLSLSDGITCESEYMATFARKYNSNIHFVSDSPQVDSFDPFRGWVVRDPERVVLGWVGSPSTCTALYKIWEPLETLFSRHDNLHLRIVGGDLASLPRFEKVKWSCIPSYDQQTMVQELLQMDIGLFPLFHVEEALARGILKPMVYMSGEVAAVCERFGDSCHLISDGVNGVLASSPEEWLEKLEWLVENPEERRRIAKEGLETVRQNFSRERVFGQLTAAIEAVARG